MAAGLQQHLATAVSGIVFGEAMPWGLCIVRKVCTAVGSGYSSGRGAGKAGACLKMPRMGRPLFNASLLVMSRTAEAPSLTCGKFHQHVRHISPNDIDLSIKDYW